MPDDVAAPDGDLDGDLDGEPVGRPGRGPDGAPDGDLDGDLDGDPGWEEEQAEPRVPLRLSRRGFAVIGVLVAALLGTVCWLVYFSSVLDVRKVTVSGTSVLTADQVLAAAAVPLGGPLERLDTGAVQARVLRALPRVARAEVSTSLPHTVLVRITERVPVAAVKGADGRYTQVDAGGVRFATGSTPPPGVPVVELALSEAGKAGLQNFPEQVLVASAVDVAKALPASVAKQTRSVVVHSFDDLELQLASGSRVLWGSSERDSRKAVVLAALLRQKGSTYDVSAPDDPAVKE
ncbi:cell division protein FtsQ [Streptacidiphilus sp. MAP12-16]|uniref:cell division protein FtsQ/DivIB n=1 Tax=Streptacidiphilus sp. MAP12-16 TaxID=3156300 RepID=UPI003513EAE1